MSGWEQERLARVVLSRVTEPGDHRFTGLAAQLSATVLLEQLAAHDRDLSVPDPQALRQDARIRLRDIDPALELERADRLGVRFVIPGDDEWPVQLDDLAHAEPLHERGGVPFGLWVKGPLRLDELVNSVAVVGSRSATTYGGEAAAELAAAVARAGHPVVSGAAFGIDLAAHRGAVAAGGLTAAVLACGADRIYPATHRSLFDYLAKHGAVISEAPPGSAPMRIRFLARNRLIAALTIGTVVVEAAVRSGALNTANWATRLNRHLMGVPGSITSAPSQGVHQLVRSGAATLVTTGGEVLEIVAPAGEQLAAEPRGRERPRDRLTTRQQQVLDAVPLANPASVDSIAWAAGIDLVQVQKTLDGLRQRGLVEWGPSGWRLAALAHQ